MRITVLIVILALLQQFNASNCWRRSYDRGEGSAVGSCEEGYESQGGLCYPLCSEGYYGVGPVCWQSCPPGFDDTGVDCLKPSSYGRGAGYVSMSLCLKEYVECEQWGALYYPKCAMGFHNVACCVCSPNCINGMTDIGVSCQKQTYGRGAGTLCPADQELEVDKCYKKCKDGYSAKAQKCEQNCGSRQSSCGYLCIDGGLKECEQVAVDIANALRSVSDIVQGKATVKEVIDRISTVANDLGHGYCGATEQLTLK